MTSTKFMSFSQGQIEKMNELKLQVVHFVFYGHDKVTAELIATETKRLNMQMNYGYTPLQLFCVVQDVCTFLAVSFPDNVPLDEYDLFVKKYLI